MLELKNLTFSFGLETIFDQTAFYANKNELTVIAGKSGSGKSTLLDIISCKYPDVCEYYFQENKITTINQNEFMSKIYYISQEPLFPEDLKIKDQWHLLQQIYQKSKNLDHYITVLKLEKTLNLYPSQLSGGEKLRVALINALLCQSEILLLDEPTAALNEQLSLAMIDILNDYKKECIIIISSHDDRLISSSEHLYEIENKKLVEKKAKIKNQTEITKHLDKHQILWFKPFIKIRKHHKFKNALKYLLLSLSVAFSCFAFWMNEEFINSYFDNLSKLESDEVLLYKAIDKQIPDFDTSNYNFPITDEELDLISQVDHIEKITPKIILNIYTSNINDIDYIPLKLQILNNDKIIYDIQDDDNTIIFESFNSDSKQNKPSITYLNNDHQGIYLHKNFVSSHNLNEDDLKNSTVTFDIGSPIYDLSGLTSTYISLSADDQVNDDLFIPCNDIVPKKVTMTLPVAGIYQSGMDNIVGGDNAFLISETILIDLCNSTKGNEFKTEYYNVNGPCTIDEATETLIYTPWQPNGYIIKIDELENVESTVDKLTALGFTVDWKYNDYNIFGNSLIETKNFLKLISIILIVLITFLIMAVNYLKNKNEHIFNRWLNQLGYSQKRQLVKIKAQGYLLDTLISIILSVVLTKFILDVVSKIQNIYYPLTLKMIITAIILVLVTQFIVPMIWEVFDHDHS